MSEAPAEGAIAEAPNQVASTSYQPRPARKQVTKAKFDAIREAFSARPESAGTFNIWYENHAGVDREENEAQKAKRETRCDIARDSGYTRADITLKTQAARVQQGASIGPDEAVYCCIHFARGCCPHGVECNFLHRLPRSNDFPSQGRDCFGREKLGNYKDDMSGTGSLSKINRTLYVGRIHEEHGVSSPSAPANAAWRDGGKTLKGGRSINDVKKHSGPRQRQDPKTYRPQHNSVRPETDNATERVIRRHFSEWGEIDKLRVLTGKSCAFVTFKYEANAQFAKEAMLNQSLDHNEIINVRWASDDPNPAAQKRNQEQLRRAGEHVIMAGMSSQAIEAQQALRALEGLEHEGGEDVHSKRRRIAQQSYDEELRRLEEENERGWAEFERERQAAAAAALAAEREAQPNQLSAATSKVGVTGSLLNSETMTHLASLQTPDKKQAAPTSKKHSAPSTSNGLGSLAAYGSDSEDENS
ncbi:Pre-mRNA-splicing factor CWC2 [Pseudozyma hubeiensis]|nr:Pre-mRNA-splicing factor CWC2 [Pseudozyma hubeiensis]